MNDQEKAAERFEFLIAPASAGRAFALGYACLFLIVVLSVPLLSSGSSGGFEFIYEPIFWLLLLGISPLVAFFILLAFPPRSWRAHLEIDLQAIRYVPVPALRWIGEPATALPITAQSHELLICSGSKDIYGGVFVTDSRAFPYGFRVIVRSVDGHDHELKVKTGSRLNPRQAQELVSGIASATGLPVRLVKREVGDDGTPREASWTPETRLDGLATLAKLAFAAAPILAGVIVGLLRASAPFAALAGILLWLAQTAVVLISSRRSQKPSKLGFLYWLTTAVTFAASYSVVFLITINSLRAR